MHVRNEWTTVNLLSKKNTTAASSIYFLMWSFQLSVRLLMFKMNWFWWNKEVDDKIHLRNRNYNTWCGAEDELWSLTAWGEKLLCSLSVRQRTLWYLLPDSSRANRLWLGRVSSFSVLRTLLRFLTHHMFCRWVPVTIWAVLITRCRLFLSSLWSFQSGCFLLLLCKS